MFAAGEALIQNAGTKSKLTLVQRLKATVTKMLADIPEEKRNGNSVRVMSYPFPMILPGLLTNGKMLWAVDSMIHYAPESVVRARSTLVKAVYLKRINRLLIDEPETVTAQLGELREYLCAPENIRVLVIGNIEKLPSPVSSWKALVGDCKTGKPLNPIDRSYSRLTAAGKYPGGLTYVVPMHTIDSSYSMQTGRGPNAYDDPRLPALLVATAYLDAVEGPLWTAVRGTGLAYGTGFYRDTDAGHLQFRVYRSPDAHKAFVASKQAVEDHISGATPFDPLGLEGAVSSIVVAFADEQVSMSTAAQMSFVNQVVRGLSPNYSSEILKKVRAIGVDEVKDVLKKIVLPIFESKTANLVVTCAPVMQEVSFHLHALYSCTRERDVRDCCSYSLAPLGNL
jgi:Zn-dependent M16 (insulinase) family peptidase